MEKKLRRVFDYQSFSPNKHLSAMIEEVENRYRELDEEELFLVSAAGNMNITNRLLEKNEYTDRNM